MLPCVLCDFDLFRPGGRREASQGELSGARFGDPNQYKPRIISMREQQFRNDSARGRLADRTNRTCAQRPRVMPAAGARVSPRLPSFDRRGGNDKRGLNQ